MADGRITVTFANAPPEQATHRLLDRGDVEVKDAQATWRWTRYDPAQDDVRVGDLRYGACG